jgi:tetracycline resistance efflux pump
MLNSWIVLIPPVLVVIMAATTQRVFLSLFSGIFSALFILNDYCVYKTLRQMIVKIWETTELGTITSWTSFWDAWYLFICLFLIVLGILIVVLRVSGGAYAYGTFVKKYIKTDKHAEIALMLLSYLFFVDEYYASLTVGSVMQMVTDKFKIPRIKLAVLINSVAPSLVVLFPVSSWVAHIMLQLKKSGLSPKNVAGTHILGDPFTVYLQIIPFIFYACIVVISLWFMVLRRISFGVIRKAEQITEKTGNVFLGKKPLKGSSDIPSEKVIASSSLIDFLFPILTLFVTAFAAFLYFGNSSLFGGSATVIEAFQNSQAAAALFTSSFATMLISIFFLITHKKLNVKQVPSLFWEGISLMGPSVLALILIWTLSNLIRTDLGTGHYLAHLLLGHVNISLLPFMFFLVSVLVSSGMGSAWGTMGIMISIGIPMLLTFSQTQAPTVVAELPMLFPLMGSIISGSVVGNHFSPISDTTLMSSISTGISHIDLVRAQIDFALPCVISAGVSFLCAGFFIEKFNFSITIVLSLGIGVLINFVILQLLHLLSRRSKY